MFFCLLQWAKEQYYLSGLLVANGCPYWLLVVCLAVLAERAFKLFDDTRAGLIVSLATAVLGPLIEVRRRSDSVVRIGGGCGSAVYGNVLWACTMCHYALVVFFTHTISCPVEFPFCA